jgi:hypothetical protein
MEIVQHYSQIEKCDARAEMRPRPSLCGFAKGQDTGRQLDFGIEPMPRFRMRQEKR